MERWINGWLVTGLVMILFQIVLGGITRLTGSGLSITKWEIVTGTIPPLNEEAWQRQFDLYRETPQYEKINRGMLLSEFKVIYFWEYLHRLWARLMGMVFILPFAFFIWRRAMNRRLIKKLVVLMILAGLVASFGWIMVASGLENRPWVDAYKLTMHLGLACVVFSYLLWIFLERNMTREYMLRRDKNWMLLLLTVVGTQILLGGVMAGTKAAMFYPTWPDMQGAFIPQILLENQSWTWSNFVRYEDNLFLVSLAQFVHRMLAYGIFILGLITVIQYHGKGRFLSVMSKVFLGILTIQILLGIWTVTSSIGQIPVLSGVLHQIFGIVMLGVTLSMVFRIKPNSDQFTTLEIE